MFIALTGLHCSGKSYFSSNLPPEFGYTVFRKCDIVETIFEREGTENYSDSHKWYNDQFENNPNNITIKIIEEVASFGDNVILDAVHSNLEWEIIKTIRPDAKLIEFVTPKSVREKRWESKYVLDDKDASRINFWHNSKAQSRCLLTEVDWVFNGCASLNFNNECFREFLEFNKSKCFEDDKQKSIDKIKVIKEN